MKKRLGIALAASIVVLIGMLIHFEKTKSRDDELRLLCMGLFSADPVKRSEAETSLKTLGPKAVPGLTAILNKKANVLERLGARFGGSLPILIRRFCNRFLFPAVLTSDAHAGAARALGLLGPTAGSAAPALIRALHDLNPQVSTDAAVALGRIGKPAVFGLVQTLESTNYNAVDLSLFALGEIGPDAQAASTRISEFLKRGDPHLRETAFHSLRKIGTPVLPNLISAMGTSSATGRVEAARLYLNYLKSYRTAIPALVDLTKAEEPQLRQVSAEALGLLGIPDPRSVAALEILLSDPNPETSVIAARALRHLRRATNGMKADE